MSDGDLDAVAVRACDPTGQAAEMLDLPTHLRDALWRVESGGGGARAGPAGPGGGRPSRRARPATA